MRMLLFTLFLSTTQVLAQEPSLKGRWHLGLEFGEIPVHGSFKPGLSFGYHVNDLVYIGVVYQIRDSIKRNGTSFNAQAIGFDGLLSSSEHVGQRGYLQVRLRPHRYAPYASLGVVFNDRDTETILFDDRQHHIGHESVEGNLWIIQSRPRGIRPALGLGYSYVFASGVELFTEWSGWWLFGAPTPEVTMGGTALSDATEALLHQRIVDKFKSSPFNTYHVFQMGVAYTW